MSEFEKAVTGLGEECGVFGAYDVDGHDVAASVSTCNSLGERRKYRNIRIFVCGTEIVFVRDYGDVF